VNIQQFRHSVRDKWLSYYAENREWIIRLQVWVNCDGQQRPASSFILATLSVLEPQLNQLLPLIVDLSNNPDRIVAALGLNFNPDQDLERNARNQMEAPKAISEDRSTCADSVVKLLPSANGNSPFNPVASPSAVSKLDETCQEERYRPMNPS
jgi:hypothetical protein